MSATSFHALLVLVDDDDATRAVLDRQREHAVHDRGLRRAIRKLGIAALMVTSEPVAQSQLPARKAFRPRPALHT